MKNRKQRPRSSRSRSDVLLATTGVLLAFGSVSFPWHVYFNPQMYGPPRIEFSGEWKKNAIADIAGKLEQTPPALAGGPDDIITGTVPTEARRQARSNVVTDMPFPAGDSDYDIVAIMEGQAVISSAGQTYVIEAGSRLPDGASVTLIRRTIDGGEIRTAEGRVYRMGSR